MTNPIYTPLHCSNCHAEMGKVPGIKVIGGLVCDDPLCVYQVVPFPELARDSYIVALAMDRARVSQVAVAAGLSRQRVYQIFNRWKHGGI